MRMNSGKVYYITEINGLFAGISPIFGPLQPVYSVVQPLSITYEFAKCFVLFDKAEVFVVFSSQLFLFKVD